MNLVFIYGPPAVGKLTVAEELGKITGYRVFHNHLTMDLAREIYPEFGPQRLVLSGQLRLAVFACAAATDTDLIFTVVYSADRDVDSVANTVNTVEQSGGVVMFVQLTAADEEILNRVNDQSRRRFHKLTDPEILKEGLRDKQWAASISHRHHLCIDTSRTNPAEAAAAIVRHFRL